MPGRERYFGHDASAMSATEAARIAAILPLPKKRGAVAPKGFTRRYGNTIAARIGVVGRDGLDACVYKGATAPVNKAPPPVTKKSSGRFRARNMKRRSRCRRSKMRSKSRHHFDEPATPAEPAQNSAEPPPPVEQPEEPTNGV